jgi:hypothetical protein
VKQLVGGQTRADDSEVRDELYVPPGDEFYFEHDDADVVQEPFENMLWDGHEPLFFVPVPWPSDVVLTRVDATQRLGVGGCRTPVQVRDCFSLNGCCGEGITLLVAHRSTLRSLPVAKRGQQWSYRPSISMHRVTTFITTATGWWKIHSMRRCGMVANLNSSFPCAGRRMLC